MQVWVATHTYKPFISTSLIVDLHSIHRTRADYTRREGLHARKGDPESLKLAVPLD